MTNMNKEKENLINYILENYKQSDFVGMDDGEIVDMLFEKYPIPCEYSYFWEVAELLDEIYEKHEQSKTAKTVKIREFLDLYKKELDKLFSDDSELSETAHIYGYDITIHWNGYIVNIGDGAIPTQSLVPALEEMDEEYEGEM